MTYSRVPFPVGVRRVQMKQPQRVTPNNFANTELVADKFGDTWCVWNRESGEVKAVFYHKPNVHGWSASEAHAKSYVICSERFNPFELDNIA